MASEAHPSARRSAGAGPSRGRFGRRGVPATGAGDPGGSSPRRPVTRMSAVSLAGHVLYELLAGVGAPFASVLGAAPAAGLWTLGTAEVVARARTAPRSSDGAFATANGIALAAVVAHLVGWPRRWRRGLPWLTECEGLGPEMMPAYNAVVYAGGASALVALATENRSAPLWRAVGPLAAVPFLVRLQHWEHRRLRAEAARRPGWWNRRLQPTAASRH